MAEIPTELVAYIVDAAGRGFNPHYDKIGALARDLLEARKELHGWETSEQELSNRYVRLREKLAPFGAMNTKHGGEDRFEKTEAALDALLTQLAEQRAELVGRLSEEFQKVLVRYDTTVDHYREMARRLVEDRDAMKHRIRSLVALLKESKREHSDGEDMVCATDYAAPNPGPCDCGADAWNAKVDETTR